MDGMLRYLENKIRGMLRMKNNLSRAAIDPLHKSFLDKILFSYEARCAVMPPETKKEKEQQEIPREPRKIRVDLKKAYEIESESWETTRELTEAFTEGESELITLGGKKDEEFDRNYQKDLSSLKKTAAGGDDEFWEFAALLTENEDHLVTILLYENAEAGRKYAFSAGEFFEQMIAAINLKAQETLGDVICDAAGKIYEDYLLSLQTVFFKGDSHGTGSR